MKKYKYFVSYSHSTGFGNIEVETEKIRSYKHLEEIKAAIEKMSNVKGVIIINFIKM